MAPQKQPSRKTKRAWRKNIDLSEVSSGLERARDEITKGGIIAEKPSTELFQLDTTGSSAIQKKYARHKLKSDQILAQRSAIPAVTSKTHRVSERRTKISHGQASSHAQASGHGLRDQLYDPWALIPQVDEFTYLDKKEPVRPPSTLRSAPISLGPSVPLPDPGQSYNPTFQDWDSLLAQKGAEAVQAERKRLQQEAEERERQARIAAEPDISDMQTEDESAWEGFDSEAEWLKKRPERKTPQQRKKALRRKQAEREEKHRQQMKERARRDQLAFSTSIQTIQGSTKSIQRSAKSHAHLDLELVLPDELQDSLRLLKPEGNLLKDRFRNISISGKMESRKPVQQARKKRRTVTEKWTHKDVVSM